MTIGEKIKVLRRNSGKTQKELAEKLCCTEDAVSKWETGSNMPPIDRLKEIAQQFCVGIEELVDDSVNIYEYVHLETVPGDWYQVVRTDKKTGETITDSDHKIYFADLRKGAALHRFNNSCGVPYSAIYIGSTEMFSCERDREADMIRSWNK